MGEHKERMLRGELYRADDPELLADYRRCQGLLRRFNALGNDQPDQQRALLAEILGGLAEGTIVRGPLYCDYGIHIRIGPRTFINYGTVILDCAPVQIGADVQIATNVQLLTASHPLDAAARAKGWEFARPIAVGDGTWLGGGVIVCPGVSIGPGSVVGAGSVVTRDVPAGVLAVGNPCRVLREL